MKMKALILIVIFFLVSYTGCRKDHEAEAQKFLDTYTRTYQALDYESSKGSWLANTDINEKNTQIRITARKKLVQFKGKKDNITTAKELLTHKEHLKPVTVKQLEAVLYEAAKGPGTIPEVTANLVEAEARQTEALYSFEFKLADGQRVNPNEIDRMLLEETDVDKRLKIWQASKEVGRGLKKGLVRLRDLRNGVAREMGYTSFFDLETSDYGMKAQEMVELMDRVYREIKPLYAHLYTWVKYKLAERYNQPVPAKMPAHWLPNRWAQEWPNIVEGVDLYKLFEEQTPRWVVQKAENFYVSMGFSRLPEVFWEKSDLYPVSADSKRKKNTHASAWHLDLDHDVRSLMSVENNSYWFETTHHELGHIYYFLSYSTPDVPVLLRGGANRGFHEGIGDLIGIASKQAPYLREINLLTDEVEIDQIQWLLNEALSNIVFIPWSAGVMTHFEYDLYENNLPEDEFNRRWWSYVEQYQEVLPPAFRGEEYCDAASKTHINNDPAQYYDYAMAKLLQYQFHDYICKHILKTSPHEANYYNSKEVGDYLRGIMSYGQTRDWRELLREKTGEDLSARAMLAYFKPLLEFLQKENEGRKLIF
jgi:peptidyl-dipeptidase A